MVAARSHELGTREQRGTDGLRTRRRRDARQGRRHPRALGRNQTRAGLGGTYAALGGWALVSRDPTAQAAVGVTWLGAAAARIGSLVLDRPRTDGAYWAYLAAEIGLGAVALVGARRARGRL
jgi:hypothetical protein